MNDLLGIQSIGDIRNEEENEENHDEEEEELNIERFVSSGSSNQCSICLNTIQTGAECGRLTCGHYYHFNCIERWLNVNSTCPTCRRNTASGTSRSERRTQTHTYTYRPRFLSQRSIVSQVISQFDTASVHIHFVTERLDGPRRVETLWNIHEPMLHILDFVSKFLKPEEDFYLKLDDTIFKFSESYNHLSKELIHFITAYDVHIYVYTV